MRDQPAKIDVWSFSLDCDPAELLLAKDLLSTDERDRARGFHFERHRRRFTVRRSMRRVLLAHLVGYEPSQIQYEESSYGKPRLGGTSTALEFSSSHSGDRGIVVTGTCPLGVDIEALDRPIDHLDFARRSLADEEYEEIRRARGSARRTAFFNCWTGKEAYMKSLGLGLSKGLRSFAVSCAPDEAPGLRWDKEQPEATAAYSFLRRFDDTHVISVAMKHPADAIRPVFHELSTSSLRVLGPVTESCGPNWRDSARA